MSAAVWAAARAPASAPTSTATTPTMRTNPARAIPTRVAPPRSPAGRAKRLPLVAVGRAHGAAGTAGGLTGRPERRAGSPVGRDRRWPELAGRDRGGLDDDRMDAEGQADGQLHRGSDACRPIGHDRNLGGAPGRERGPGGRRRPGRVATDSCLPGRLASRTLREDLVT